MSIRDLSIILVSLNNKEYLEPCLESLLRGGQESSFDVVVVDNGSSDGSQQMLQEKYPEVMRIQNSSNVGLGRASNQGIRATQGRYVLLLNDDTLVNGRSLDILLRFLDDTPEAGAVGGQRMRSSSPLVMSYNNFSTLREEFLIATRLGEILWTGYPAIIEDEQVRQVSWMGSASLMLRREALDQVGLLDEDYFIYGDEADLQYRLQIAGWRAYYLPQATTIHFGGRSMERWPRRKMVYRGKMLFYQKNYGPIRTYALRIMLGVLSLAKVAFWGVRVLFPSERRQAGREIDSNREVIMICWSLK